MIGASDVRWREALWGAAASLRQLAAGPGLLSLHAFASYAPRAVYQYELVDRRRCPDPGRAEDPACAAPPVIQAPLGELLSPAFRHAHQTLPAMFAEALAGAHAGYALPSGLRAGLTGYGARSRALVGGAELVTQVGARLPGGRGFGALGGELAFRRGGAELGAEVARSLGADGLGAVLRLALSRGGQGAEGELGGPGGSELELTGRYYQTSFANPYGRPLAAADELLGQRARDEAGVRARASRWWPRGSVRAELDAWKSLSASALKLASAVRGEVQLHPRWRGGAGLSFDDKSLAHGGRSECFEGAAAAGDDAEPAACRGEKLAASARLTALWSPLFDTTAQVQHEVLGAGDGWKQRLTLWLLARRRAASGMQVRAQLRYRDEALGAAAARSLGGGGEVRIPLGATGRLAVRLDGQLTLSSGGSVAAGALQTLSLGVGYDVEL